MHTLTEHYLKNDKLPKVPPISDFLFKISKPKLKNIGKIIQRIIKEELERHSIIKDIADWMNDNGRYIPDKATIDDWWTANSKFYPQEKEQEIKSILLKNSDEIEEVMSQFS